MIADFSTLLESDPADRWHSTRSWVTWGSGDTAETVRLSQLAEAVGADAGTLLAWLENAAPTDGTARVAGRVIRWATAEEAAIARQHPPEWATPAGSVRVLWTAPSGHQEQLTIADAARRLQKGDRKCPPQALLLALQDGALTLQGHVLRLVDATHPKHLPLPPIRSGRPRKPSPIEPRASESNVVAMTGPRVQGLPQPVAIDGEVFPSAVAAADALGVPRSTLTRRLREWGSVTVNGHEVRAIAPDTTPVIDEEQPTVTSATDQQQAIATSEDTPAPDAPSPEPEETIADEGDPQQPGRQWIRISIDGAEYRSALAAAAALGVPRSTLVRHLQASPSVEIDGRRVELLAACPWKTAPRSRVLVDGEPHRSVAAAARAIAVPHSTLHRYLQARDTVTVHGHTVQIVAEDAPAPPLLPRGKRRQVLVDGAQFPSMRSAATALGIAAATLRGALSDYQAVEIEGHRVELLGDDGSRIVDPSTPARQILLPDTPPRRGRPVWVDGQRYESVEVAARAADCSPPTLFNALKRGRTMVRGHRIATTPPEDPALPAPPPEQQAIAPDEGDQPPPAAGPQTAPEAPTTALEPDPPPPAPTAGLSLSPALLARLEQAAKDVDVTVETLLWAGLPRSAALREAIASLDAGDLMQLAALAQVGGIPLPAVPGQQRSTRAWYAAPPR